MVLVSVIAILSMGLSGCSKRVHYRGKAPDLKIIHALNIGTSTQSDVLKAIGSPTFETQYGPKTWFYVSKKLENFAFLPPKIIEKQTISITFDSGGIVTKIEDHDPHMKDINPVQNRTPDAVAERPLLQQVFANFGRIAKAGDKKAK